MRFRRVEESINERMLRQGAVHDAALDADAAAVDQAHLLKSRLVRRTHVFVDDRRNVIRPERVEIELGLNRNAVRIRHCDFEYEAVTVVEIPPLGVKSPTTVIRRGEHAATRSSRI